MTENDRPAFAHLMFALGEAFGEVISEARLEIYFQALSDLTIAQVRTAATVHLKGQKFFPRVAELREATAGSVDDRAELAWTQLLTEVRRCGYAAYLPGPDGNPANPPQFLDDAAKRTALEMFGGWRALCDKLPPGGPELLGCAKQFKATYRALARSGVREAALELTKDETHSALLNLADELGKRGLPTPGLPSASRNRVARGNLRIMVKESS